MTTAVDAGQLVQALYFRAECDALHAVLVAAPAAAWTRPTQFKQWTFDDVLGHLRMFDYASELAARGRAWRWRRRGCDGLNCGRRGLLRNDAHLMDRRTGSERQDGSQANGGRTHRCELGGEGARW